MDRIGRVPVLAAGFGIGAAGCGLAALGNSGGSAAAVTGGLMAVGAASGTALLARVAAGDMYPLELRARGIALVVTPALCGSCAMGGWCRSPPVVRDAVRRSCGSVVPSSKMCAGRIQMTTKRVGRPRWRGLWG